MSRARRDTRADIPEEFMNTERRIEVDRASFVIEVDGDPDWIRFACDC